MRDSFAREMTNMAKARQDICLLSGDIGNRMFDKFKETAPSRFFNCGIAEGCMMSVASGLALSGMRPVVYTITPFTTTRCLEQIKIGACYHKAPIVIVGTGSGLSYSELGATHHSLEDIGIMRSLPDIDICAPADSIELVAQLNAAMYSDKPTYIRIGKKGEPLIHQDGSQVGIGKANLIKDGKDLIVMSIGPIISEALEAAYSLESSGMSIAVASLGTVKPLDHEFLSKMSKRFKSWICLEEHSVIGGAGSALSDWLFSTRTHDIRLVKMGTPDTFIHELGSQAYVRHRLGLDREGIVLSIMRILNEDE